MQYNFLETFSTQMRARENIVEELASEFIYKKLPDDPIYLKIHGIAQTGSLTEPTIEVYHQSGFKEKEVLQIFGAYQNKLTFKSIATGGFQPFHLKSGMAIRNETSENYGTLGAFVKDHQTDEWLILSNHHVLSPQPQTQYSPEIIEVASDQIMGKLLRTVPLKPAPSKNHIDAGVASLVTDYVQNETEQYQVSTKTFLRGEKVYKVGAASGKTFGQIISQNSAIRVNYGALGILYFENSLVIRGDNSQTFSKPGDSGSLIFDENNQVIALLYAGDSQSNIAFACPIQKVIQELQIRFA